VSNPWVINMGPCLALFGTTLLDATFGDTKLNLALKTADKRIEQQGNAPVDKVILGYDVTAEVPVAECDLEELVTLIPGSALSSGSKSKSLTVKQSGGQMLRTLAKTLILKPCFNGDALESKYWRTIPLASVEPEFSETFNSTGTQSVYLVKFTAFVDSNDAVLIFGADSTSRP